MVDTPEIVTTFNTPDISTLVRGDSVIIPVAADPEPPALVYIGWFCATATILFPVPDTAIPVQLKLDGFGPVPVHDRPESVDMYMLSLYPATARVDPSEEDETVVPEFTPRSFSAVQLAPESVDRCATSLAVAISIEPLEDDAIELQFVVIYRSSQFSPASIDV